MYIFQQLSDKLAISLSAACAIHCLALPLIASFLPSILAMPFAEESFHFWMVVCVIPVSIYALTLGCKKHKRFRVLGLGVVGLAILIAAVIWGESHLSELQEKLLTLVGASVIAFGHLWNFRLCQHRKNCPCPA